MQNATSQMQLAEDTCHIKADSESAALFDIDSVWCSFCQRPRFDDGLRTDLCICVSFSSTTTNNSTWLPQAVDNTAFQNLKSRHYDAVDTWLYGSVDNDAYHVPNAQNRAFDSMIGISPVATSLGLYSISTSAEDVSSPARSITPMTRGSSVTSTSSRTPSCEREPARISLELDSSDSSEFRRMLNAKQRRREQNRNSQHRFRERRNQVTKNLQEKVDSLTKINEILNREIAALRKNLGAGEGQGEP